MSWKDEFDEKTLRVGKRFFEKGYVDGFVDLGDSISALVDTGKEKFYVSIDNPGTPDIGMRCTCYFAFNGFECYHMAAVMYHWERHCKTDLIGKKRLCDILPECDPESKPYFFIPDMADRYSVRNEDYEKACDLLEKNEITEAAAPYLYYEKNHASIKIKNSLLAVYKVTDVLRNYEITISLNGDEIVSLRCEKCSLYMGSRFISYHSYAKYDLCPHMTAALMLLDKYTRTFDPGDDTDKTADRFLGFFHRERENEAKSEETKKAGGVSLVPVITKNRRGSYEVSFKTGNDKKLYVVKSIYDLYRAVKNSEIYPLGKNSEIDFGREYFDESAAILFDMIDKSLGRRFKALENMDDSIYYDPGLYDLKSVKNLILNGVVADGVFDSMNGRRLDIKNIYGNISCVNITDTVQPKVSVNVEPLDETPLSLQISGNVPDIINGASYNYAFDDNNFIRMNDETWDKIRPFSEAAVNGDTSFSFVIGSKKAADFYYNILPKLESDPLFNVNTDEAIADAINPEADFTFFLDAEDGCILCRAEAEYGIAKDIIKPLHFENLPFASYRDVYQENDIRELLYFYFESFDPERNTFYTDDNDDLKYEFIKTGVSRLLSRGEVQATESFDALKIKRSTPVTFGVSVESDLLNLDIRTDDMEPDELMAVLDSYKKKKRYHKLRNGTFVELDGNDSLETLFEMTEMLGVNVNDYIKGHLQIPAYRALYLDRMLEEHEELAADRDKHFKQIIKNFKTINDSDFDVPKGLTDTLRSYQEYGYKWLKTLESAGFGGILADDMGLGKTLQLITLLVRAKEEGELNALVVCPASLVYNWIEEFKKFAPDLKAAPLAGTKSERKNLLADHKEYDALVTSYDLLKRDIDLYEDVTFTHQILDEAQYIKNAKAQAAKSVKLVKAGHRFALTGTPIENRLSELWSIFDFLMPGFLYGYERFRTDFEAPIVKHDNDKAMEALRKMVSPFLLRRKKGDVLKDLPDKVEEVLYAGMESKQRKVYDAQATKLKAFVASKEDDFDKSKIEILAELTKIRQICCDPGLLFEDYDGESAKREACLELLENVADGGHKTLLFSQFTSMLALLEDDLKKMGLDYYKITGETPKEERLKLVKAFNADETPVFLISLKAGGTGLNLTGADIVIHYDPWWNTAAQDQATDRAHRIGQTKKVTVYRIIAKDTIEEKILKLQETKKELADSVLSGETRSLGSMTKEELLEILG